MSHNEVLHLFYHKTLNFTLNCHYYPIDMIVVENYTILRTLCMDESKSKGEKEGIILGGFFS